MSFTLGGKRNSSEKDAKKYVFPIALWFIWTYRQTTVIVINSLALMVHQAVSVIEIPMVEIVVSRYAAAMDTIHEQYESQDNVLVSLFGAVELSVMSVNQ